MSGKAVGWAFKQNCGSAAVKLVLVKLADNANEDGDCWPSVSYQSRETELSDRTVRKSIKRLVILGKVSVERRIGPSGQRSNMYRLNVPWRKLRLGYPPAASSAQGVTCEASDHAQSASPLLTAAQGHIEEPSNQPSLNTATQHPFLEKHFMTLRTVFEEPWILTWFGHASYRDGPPFALIFPKRFQRNFIRDRHGHELGKLFGDNMLFESQEP